MFTFALILSASLAAQPPGLPEILNAYTAGRLSPVGFYVAVDALTRGDPIVMDDTPLRCHYDANPLEDPVFAFMCPTTPVRKTYYFVCEPDCDLAPSPSWIVDLRIFSYTCPGGYYWNAGVPGDNDQWCGCVKQQWVYISEDMQTLAEMWSACCDMPPGDARKQCRDNLQITGNNMVSNYMLEVVNCLCQAHR